MTKDETSSLLKMLIELYKHPSITVRRLSKSLFQVLTRLENGDETIE